MKKVILVANVAKEHILKFHVPTIQMLKKRGWTVDVACSGSEEVPYCDHQYYMIYKRNPFSLRTIQGIIQLRRILKREKYDVLSCHTPTGGVVARIAAIGLKERPYVIYTAHGFHFFKGAPVVNWLIYFPIEWLLGHVTDELVVINKEDYKNAQILHMGMKKISILNGMGVDKERFTVDMSDEDKSAIKESLGLPANSFVFIYVAEIIKNKNQQVLIKALSDLRKETGRGHLLLVGPIHDKGECQKLVSKLGLDNYVVFTGWRDDIEKLYHISDICVASSIREGLGLNLIEAQYSGVPVIASDNRGHRDIIVHKKNGLLISYKRVAEWTKAMKHLMNSTKERELFARNAKISAEKFCKERSLDTIIKIITKE